MDLQSTVAAEGGHCYLDHLPLLGTEYIVNPRHACTARVTVFGLCVSVCSYSQTTGYKAAYKQYQRLQIYVNLKSKMVISERLREICDCERYAVKTSDNTNMHNRTGLPRPALLYITLEAEEVTMKGTYRLSRAIYSL